MQKLKHSKIFSNCPLISARTFYMASLPEKDAEEDHGDAGLTTSSNGLEYPSQSVFSTQRTEERGEPWCPRQWPPILSHEDGPRQGNAISIIIDSCMVFSTDVPWYQPSIAHFHGHRIGLQHLRLSTLTTGSRDLSHAQYKKFVTHHWYTEAWIIYDKTYLSNSSCCIRISDVYHRQPRQLLFR